MPTTWVSFSKGRLIYRADSYGNRVPDFSYVGYHSGNKRIPAVRARVTLGPGGSGDDTTRIQTAINSAAKAGGGAVVLKPGTYRLAGTVHLNRSGVVLHGSGGSRTLLAGAGKPHTLITIGGRGSIRRVGGAHRITDRYVPVGSRVVHVAAANKYFKAGDNIIVQRPIGNKWIHAIGMDKIPPRTDGRPITQWKPSPGHEFERRVIKVSGNTILFDAPLPQALESQYANSSVWKYQFPGRIKEAGLEYLSATGQAFESHPSWRGGGFFNSRLVSMESAEDSWVRSVSAKRFGQAYNFGRGALHDTMINTTATNVSVPKGVSAWPAAYSISGQQTLIDTCKVTGSYVHAWATGSWVPGPNVVHNCTALNTGSGGLDGGPHQRWATGTLYDRVHMNATGRFSIEDRGNKGTGHGWAGANNVLWNCTGGTYLVEKPPTAYNWAIGCTGKKAAPKPGHHAGQIQSAGHNVQPPSLYREQLKERHATR
ncbi:glycosyl hydrolase family 28-related protein [Streptomyces sp. L2]|uniref:glycosyl hydrolase family 28-related protein n=1 Tax=Streptomyces sp. L2 TaxID=2162665 RepID=UPI0013E94808|nr:glycosyl hydrolase family 28-related protein [Streptomyces sp. L2]